MRYSARKNFSEPVKQQDIADDWCRRGYSCNLFADPPGREWVNFVHETNELVVVIRGRLNVTIGAEEVVAEPGDEVFIPKGVSHSVKNMASMTTEWLYGYDESACLVVR